MKLWKEFKEFAFKGNVIDLAVGVIIGSAFTAIVNSVVNDLFTPLLSLITGRVDFSTLAITLGAGENAAKIAYGSFPAGSVQFPDGRHLHLRLRQGHQQALPQGRGGEGSQARPAPLPLLLR